jgi:hypothetical protein
MGKLSREFKQGGTVSRAPSVRFYRSPPPCTIFRGLPFAGASDDLVRQLQNRQQRIRRPQLADGLQDVAASVGSREGGRHDPDRAWRLRPGSRRARQRGAGGQYHSCGDRRLAREALGGICRRVTGRRGLDHAQALHRQVDPEIPDQTQFQRLCIWGEAVVLPKVRTPSTLRWVRTQILNARHTQRTLLGNKYLLISLMFWCPRPDSNQHALAGNRF